MDQDKIGKFISSCRKEKNMTQAQLAEKLSITDRAVSKWETGKSMPDPSIMLTLCELLNINVNELLTGERLDMGNYKEAAEKNLLEQQEKETKLKRDTKIFSIIMGITIFLSTIGHFAINFFYPNNNGTGMGELIIVVGIVSYIWLFSRNYTLKLK